MIFAVIISIMIMTMTTININHNNNHHHQVIITNSITMTTSSIISLDFTLQQKHPPVAEAWSNWKRIKKSKRNRNSELAGVFRSCDFFVVQGFTIQLLLKCWSNINKKQHEGLLYPVSGAFLVYLFLMISCVFPKFNRFSPTPHAPPQPSQALPEEPPEGTADRDSTEEPKEKGDPGSWESRESPKKNLGGL